jgi:hypothetical protein
MWSVLIKVIAIARKEYVSAYLAMKDQHVSVLHARAMLTSPHVLDTEFVSLPGK